MKVMVALNLKRLFQGIGLLNLRKIYNVNMGENNYDGFRKWKIKFKRMVYIRFR
jgi:hypothetical protein